MATPRKTNIAEPKSAERYHEGIGRRKTAVARVRIVKSGAHAKPAGGPAVTVNGKDANAYFSIQALRDMVAAPLERLENTDRYAVVARVSGGGINAQAEAVRLGLARALVLLNPDFKQQLRTLGFLTRDPRMVERKKYGLKKARRAPQWKKR